MNPGCFPGVNANLLPASQLADVPFHYFTAGGANGYQVPRAEHFDAPIATGGAVFTVRNRVGRLAFQIVPSSTIGGGLLLRNAPAPPYTVDLRGGYVWPPDATSAGGSLGISFVNAQGRARILQHVCEQVSATAHVNFQAFQVDDLVLSSNTDTILARCCITSSLAANSFSRVTDDGTTRRFWMSANGLDYMQVYSEASAVLGYAVKVGFNCGASFDAAEPAGVGNVYHFSVTPGILGDAP